MGPELTLDTQIFIRQLILEKIVFIFITDFFTTFLFDAVNWGSLTSEEILSFLASESQIKDWISSFSIIDGDSIELDQNANLYRSLLQRQTFFKQYLVSSYLWLFKVFRIFFYIPADECLDYFIETLSEVGSDPLSMLSFPQNKVVTDGNN